jgi:hypothetical protein
MRCTPSATTRFATKSACSGAEMPMTIVVI